MDNTINELMKALASHDFIYEQGPSKYWWKGDAERYDMRLLIRELRSHGMKDAEIEAMIVKEFPELGKEENLPHLKAIFPPREPKPGDRFIHTYRGITRSARLGSIDTTYEVTGVMGDTCECTDLEEGGYKTFPTMEVAWLITQFIPQSQ